MIVHVVADVHGNADALARAADGADALFVLGDLIDFVDYHDPAGGILGDVLGPDASREFARLRSAGGPGELGRFAAQAWAAVDDPRARVADAVRAQYRVLFGVLGDIAAAGTPVWLTPGNVDVPATWPDLPGVTAVDGDVVEVGGRRVGFVGGVPLPPGMTPREGVFSSYMRRREEFDAAVEGLGPVDVLCSHAPPDDAELAYDVDARSRELSSPALLAAVHRDRPALALFGHVHAPLAARRRIGATECVNAGHFQRHGTPCVLRW